VWTYRSVLCHTALWPVGHECVGEHRLWCREPSVRMQFQHACEEVLQVKGGLKPGFCRLKETVVVGNLQNGAAYGICEKPNQITC
jgi:hypothetical protein